MENWIGIDEEVDLVGNGNGLGQNGDGGEAGQQNVGNQAAANEVDVQSLFTLNVPVCINGNVECPAAKFWRERSEQISIAGNQNMIKLNNLYLDADRISKRLKRAEDTVRDYQQRLFDTLNTLDPIRQELDQTKNQLLNEIRERNRYQCDAEGSKAAIQQIQAFLSDNETKTAALRNQLTQLQMKDAEKTHDIKKLQEKATAFETKYRKMKEEAKSLKEECDRYKKIAESQGRAFRRRLSGIKPVQHESQPRYDPDKSSDDNTDENNELAKELENAFAASPVRPRIAEVQGPPTKSVQPPLIPRTKAMAVLERKERQEAAGTYAGGSKRPFGVITKGQSTSGKELPRKVRKMQNEPNRPSGGATLVQFTAEDALERLSLMLKGVREEPPVSPMPDEPLMPSDDLSVVVTESSFTPTEIVGQSSAQEVVVSKQPKESNKLDESTDSEAPALEIDEQHEKEIEAPLTIEKEAQMPLPVEKEAEAALPVEKQVEMPLPVENEAATPVPVEKQSETPLPVKKQEPKSTTRQKKVQAPKVSASFKEYRGYTAILDAMLTGAGTSHSSALEKWMLKPVQPPETVVYCLIEAVKRHNSTPWISTTLRSATQPDKIRRPQMQRDQSIPSATMPKLPTNDQKLDELLKGLLHQVEKAPQWKEVPEMMLEQIQHKLAATGRQEMSANQREALCRWAFYLSQKQANLKRAKKILLSIVRQDDTGKSNQNDQAVLHVFLSLALVWPKAFKKLLTEASGEIDQILQAIFWCVLSKSNVRDKIDRFLELSDVSLPNQPPPSFDIIIRGQLAHLSSLQSTVELSKIGCQLPVEYLDEIQKLFLMAPYSDQSTELFVKSSLASVIDWYAISEEDAAARGGVQKLVIDVMLISNVALVCQKAVRERSSEILKSLKMVVFGGESGRGVVKDEDERRVLMYACLDLLTSMSDVCKAGQVKKIMELVKEMMAELEKVKLPKEEAARQHFVARVAEISVVGKKK